MCTYLSTKSSLLRWSQWMTLLFSLAWTDPSWVLALDLLWRGGDVGMSPHLSCPYRMQLCMGIWQKLRGAMSRSVVNTCVVSPLITYYLCIIAFHRDNWNVVGMFPDPSSSQGPRKGSGSETSLALTCIWQVRPNRIHAVTSIKPAWAANLTCFCQIILLWLVTQRM